MKVAALFIYLFLATAVVTQNEVLSQNPHNHTIYHLVPDYTTYQQHFASNAGQKNTLQVTYLGTGKELCTKAQACRFYIYIYEPDIKQDIKHTMLIVSGMHGNQLIGPTTLLYAYPLLKPKFTRIIYLPISNPSGYQLKRRQTFPQNIDPNRDFPIDNNTACYQGSATRILDSIFRNYTIDLTVNLHNGGDQIAWNWGTYYHQKFPETEDETIYAPIGAMLKLYGGYNERMRIEPFEIGTMDRVVYPAEGTFDDWAYAGSWAESVPFKCDKHTYKPYPKQMHQGLVFLLELGMHNAPQGLLGTSQGLQKPSNSNETSNGYVTRTLRMLRQLVFVVQPVVHAQISDDKLILKVEGCQKVQSLHIQAINQQGQQKNQIHLNSTITDFINRKDSFSYIGKVAIKQILAKQSGFELRIAYLLQCDKKWINKGKTFLSRPRLFQSNMTIVKQKGNSDKKQNFLKINGQTTNLNMNEYFMLLIPVALFIFLTYMILCRNKCKRKQNERNRPGNSRTATNHNLSGQNVYNDEFQQEDHESDPI